MIFSVVMIVAALFLIPIKIRISLFLRPDAAGIRIRFYLLGGAIKLDVAEEVKADKQRGLIYSNKKSKKYGQNVLYSLVQGHKTRKKSRFGRVLKAAGLSASVTRAEIEGVIGIKDAADKTVIALGSVNSLAATAFSLIPNAQKSISLSPDFDQSIVRLNAECILNLDAGKYIIEAIKAIRR